MNNAGQIKFSGVSFVCTKDARLRFYLNTSEATSTPAAPTASTGNAALKYTLNGAEKQYFVEECFYISKLKVFAMKTKMKFWKQ